MSVDTEIKGDPASIKQAGSWLNEKLAVKADAAAVTAQATPLQVAQLQTDLLAAQQTGTLDVNQLLTDQAAILAELTKRVYAQLSIFESYGWVQLGKVRPESVI